MLKIHSILDNSYFDLFILHLVDSADFTYDKLSIQLLH